MKQLEIDFGLVERNYLLREVTFPSGLKVNKYVLGSVMHRIASFYGKPDGCFETVANIAKFDKASESQVERALAALRKLNLLNERDRPEWDRDAARKTHHRWINFDELRMMVGRQNNATPQVVLPVEEPCIQQGGTLHIAGGNPAYSRGEPRTQVRAYIIEKENSTSHVENNLSSIDEDWRKVEVEVFSCGCGNAKKACQAARANGCSPEHVRNLVEAWKAICDRNPQQFRIPSYALYLRVSQAHSDLATTDGWIGSVAVRRVEKAPRVLTEDEIRFRIRSHLIGKGIIGEELPVALDAAVAKWRARSETVVA